MSPASHAPPPVHGQPSEPTGHGGGRSGGDSVVAPVDAEEVGSAVPPVDPVGSSPVDVAALAEPAVTLMVGVHPTTMRAATSARTPRGYRSGGVSPSPSSRTSTTSPHS